jgi:hypothetical protein
MSRAGDSTEPDQEIVMNRVDPNELSRVIGGASSVSQQKLDQQTELALTKLNSDLKDLARPQPNQSQQTMTMMMMAMMASRMR